MVGGLLDGRWYGGHYGWSWPHGWYSVGHAADRRRAGRPPPPPATTSTWTWCARPWTTIIAHGKVMAFTEADSSLRLQVDPQLAEDVPSRRCSCRTGTATAAGSTTTRCCGASRRPCGTTAADPADRRRLGRLRAAAGYDWRTVRSFRSKEEAGHEEPWFTFLAGDNPDYPEKILAAAQAQVRHRLARMERLPRTWTWPRPTSTCGSSRNPVVTEALVQLTWGGPQVIYNGGLQQARVRYYDAEARRAPACPPGRRPGLQHRPAGHRHRPGQPRPGAERTAVVQAGAFAEHTIRPCATPPARTAPGSAACTTTGTRARRSPAPPSRAGGPWLRIELPRSTRIRLTLRAHAARARPLLPQPVRRGAAVNRRPLGDTGIEDVLGRLRRVPAGRGIRSRRESAPWRPA